MIDDVLIDDDFSDGNYIPGMMMVMDVLYSISTIARHVFLLP